MYQIETEKISEVEQQIEDKQLHWIAKNTPKILSMDQAVCFICRGFDYWGVYVQRSVLRIRDRGNKKREFIIRRDRHVRSCYAVKK